MPRYYFHLRSKTAEVQDANGKDLPDHAAAIAHARVVIEKIIKHVGYDDANVWRISIRSYKFVDPIYDTGVIEVPFPKRREPVTAGGGQEGVIQPTWWNR